MAVSELGWSTLAEADSYFENERYETAEWDTAAMTDDLKNKALNMAYNRIYYNAGLTVPAAGSETAAQKVKLIKIQAEMAYYFLIHLADEDSRKGLQIQGVTDAGIAKEKYHKDMLNKLPIPPVVEELLDDFGAVGAAMAMIDVDRDEDESVSTKVDDF